MLLRTAFCLVISTYSVACGVAGRSDGDDILPPETVLQQNVDVTLYQRLINTPEIKGHQVFESRFGELDDTPGERKLSSRFGIDSEDLAPLGNGQQSDEYYVQEDLEYGKYYQGDLMLTKEQVDFLFGSRMLSSRTGITDEEFRWPKEGEHVMIPYAIHRKSNYSELTFFLMKNLNFFGKIFQPTRKK
jgi:hypothetical protein